MAEISKRPSRSPHITGVLEDAAEDLKYAEFTGYVGKVFNPVRDKVLLPATNKATEIVPIVASFIPLPFVDEVGAFALNVPIKAMRLGYSILPHSEVDKESEQIEAQELKMVGEAAMKKYKPNPFMSSLMGVAGFAANTALDIATLPFSGKLGDWLEATIMFIGMPFTNAVVSITLQNYNSQNSNINLCINRLPCLLWYWKGGFGCTGQHPGLGESVDHWTCSSQT